MFYAQGDATSLQRYLANGVPVILWLGMWGDQSYYEYADDGTPLAAFHVARHNALAGLADGTSSWLMASQRFRREGWS